MYRHRGFRRLVGTNHPCAGAWEDYFREERALQGAVETLVRNAAATEAAQSNFRSLERRQNVWQQVCDQDRERLRKCDDFLANAEPVVPIDDPRARPGAREYVNAKREAILRDMLRSCGNADNLARQADLSHIAVRRFEIQQDVHANDVSERTNSLNEKQQDAFECMDADGVENGPILPVAPPRTANAINRRMDVLRTYVRNVEDLPDDISNITQTPVVRRRPLLFAPVAEVQLPVAGSDSPINVANDDSTVGSADSEVIQPPPPRRRRLNREVNALRDYNNPGNYEIRYDNYNYRRR